MYLLSVPKVYLLNVPIKAYIRRIYSGYEAYTGPTGVYRAYGRVYVPPYGRLLRCIEVYIIKACVRRIEGEQTCVPPMYA